MKFYEKYPQLKDRNFLSKMLEDSVFSTMSLENQEVSRSKVTEIISKVLKEKEMQGSTFFSSQPSGS